MRKRRGGRERKKNGKEKGNRPDEISQIHQQICKRSHRCRLVDFKVAVALVYSKNRRIKENDSMFELISINGWNYLASVVHRF